MLLAAVFLLAAGNSVYEAFERNLCGLQQIRERTISCVGPADATGGREADLPLLFGSALLSGSPETIFAVAPGMLSRTDRIGEALVIGEARRRAASGDRVAAEGLLEIVVASNSHDPLVFYATGHGFEEVARPDRAEASYLRGLAQDTTSIRAPGRFYLAALYAGRAQWSRVLETLMVDEALTYASDVFNVRPCGLCRTPDWPAAVLMIASAYENTGRIGEAAETYRRFLLARPGGLAWQDNRALVSLASIEARPETLARALQHFARALDMTLGYPASFGAQYQDDTWRRLMDVTRALGRSDAAALAAAARSEAASQSRSPGASLVVAATSLAACESAAADAAFDRAELLDPLVRQFRDRLGGAPGANGCREP